MGSSLITLLRDRPIVPVVVVDSATAAGPLADALIEGGLPCAEVTLRTPAALEALRVLADRPDLLVGAGSVLSAGLNFTERGFGVRGAVGVSDRGHTAASQMGPDEVDWDRLFGHDGVRWFHTGGIFAALGAGTPAVVEEAMIAARRHGTVVSFDLNYRPSLWEAFGGRSRAQQVNRRLVSQVDVLVGNEEDFGAALGFEVDGGDASLAELDVDAYGTMLGRLAAAHGALAMTTPGDTSMATLAEVERLAGGGSARVQR